MYSNPFVVMVAGNSLIYKRTSSISDSKTGGIFHSSCSHTDLDFISYQALHHLESNRNAYLEELDTED